MEWSCEVMELKEELLEEVVARIKGRVWLCDFIAGSESEEEDADDLGGDRSSAGVDADTLS